MNLVVFSSKPCWISRSSPSGYATDGGFPLQMKFLSDLFDSTLLVLPQQLNGDRKGELPLVGRNIKVLPLDMPAGSGLARKLALMPWLGRNIWTIIREARKADAVHAPVPGDIGTLGMLAAFLFRKPLYVRHCGNWDVQRTLAERFWRWFMERHGGGRNVMLATGGTASPPSQRNPKLSWIFSTSLTERELVVLNQQRVWQPLPRLIIVGRQEPGKGTDVLIRSLPLISKTFPDVHLDIVGGGSAIPVLKNLSADLELENRISFHGRVDHDEVIDLLRKATLFCFPTDSEGFPKAVLEALACGLPVVTTKVSVLPYLVSQGCGKLLDRKTPEAIAQAVNDCISDREAYLEMSERARELASEHSLERWRDTIGGLLRSQWGPLTVVPDSAL
jgi:glycosyltransferase involved in cell wall biosynthesis